MLQQSSGLGTTLARGDRETYEEGESGEARPGVWLDQVTFNHLSGGRQGMSVGGHKQI